MKTRNIIIVYITLLLLTVYCQYEYFFRAASGNPLLPLPIPDIALFIIGSGALLLGFIIYLIVRKTSTPTSLHTSPLLITLLAVRLVEIVMQNISAYVNGYLTTDFVRMTSIAISVLLLLAIFIKKRVVYIIFMTLAAFHLVTFIISLANESHLSWFSFLGSGSLYHLSFIIGIFLFSFFALKDLTQPQPSDSTLPQPK